MSSGAGVPSNVRVSQHPCLQAKLSQLRSRSCDAKATKTLVHEIAGILACEALPSVLSVTRKTQDETPLGYKYDVETIAPARISLVPILRSGLAMTDAVTALLPASIAIHHLGLFREPVTLQPVEYYNNLPYHHVKPSESPEVHLAIIVDPVIATGATAVAAIQTLRDWGVSRVLMLSVLASEAGLRRAASEWPEGTEVWVGGMDAKCDDRGMIVPGVGDIGDRLFGTKGK